MDTSIFVLDYQFANPIAMDRALEIVEEFIDLNKDGTLDYTVKEIIRSIDENFYNGLSRGDKCRVGRGIRFSIWTEAVQKVLRTLTML